MMRERRKIVAHLLGRGIGRDVEVLRLEVEQQVAHRAAHHESLEAGLLQTGGHAPRAGADALARDAVLVEGDDQGVARLARTAGENALDELLYHSVAPP